MSITNHPRSGKRGDLVTRAPSGLVSERAASEPRASAAQPVYGSDPSSITTTPTGAAAWRDDTRIETLGTPPVSVLRQTVPESELPRLGAGAFPAATLGVAAVISGGSKTRRRYTPTNVVAGAGPASAHLSIPPHHGVSDVPGVGASLAYGG